MKLPWTRPAPDPAEETRGLDWHEYAWLSAGTPTAAGPTVGPETAMRVPAVRAAVAAISEAAAGLPATVQVGGAQDATHPVARLIDEGPNTWSAWPDLVRDLLADALCRDQGGLAWVNRVGGEAREVIRYRPGVLAAETLDSGECRYRLNGRAIPAADVVHVRPPGDRAPLSQAREAIGLAAALEAHVGRVLSNGGRPSGVIKTPGALNADAMKRLAASWQAAHAGEGSGRTAVLESGATFDPLTFKLIDLEYSALRTFQINEIARAFRVPPGMLYEMSRQTWSNMEQASREFLTYTLEPWLLTVEGALNRALFRPDERKTHRIVFDRDDLTRANLNDRATAINSLIASQVLNPNEARDWLGLPPREGGEVFMNPNISEVNTVE